MGRVCASLVNEFPGRKERVLLLHGHVPFEGKSGIRDHRINYTSLNGHLQGYLRNASGIEDPGVT